MTDQQTPETPHWVDGDPLMEAIAAAVWEQCRTEGSSLVVDDPRNIAVVAAAIHAYGKGWHDGTIYDPPLPGALDALRHLMEIEPVFIFTTRDVGQVAGWLIGHGLSVRIGHDGPFWNDTGSLLVTNRKLAARVYLDDRALRFENWPQALADLSPGAPQPDTGQAPAARDRRRVRDQPRRTPVPTPRRPRVLSMRQGHRPGTHQPEGHEMKRAHKINHGWQRPPDPISESYQREIDRSIEKGETRWRRAQKAVQRAQKAAERAELRATRKPNPHTAAARDEARRLVAARRAELAEIECLMRAPTNSPTAAVHRTGRQERLEVGIYRKPTKKKTPKSPMKSNRRNP
jgi:hypothetical protein